MEKSTKTEDLPSLDDILGRIPSFPKFDTSDESTDSDEDWEEKSARIARNLERDKRRKALKEKDKQRVDETVPTDPTRSVAGPSGITETIQETRENIQPVFTPVTGRITAGSEPSIPSDTLKIILGRATSGLDVDISEREFRDALGKSPALRDAVKRASVNRILEAGTIGEIRKELSSLMDVKNLTRIPMTESDLNFKIRDRPIPKGKYVVQATQRRSKPIGL